MTAVFGRARRSSTSFVFAGGVKIGLFIGDIVNNWERGIYQKEKMAERYLFQEVFLVVTFVVQSVLRFQFGVSFNFERFFAF